LIRFDYQEAQAKRIAKICVPLYVALRRKFACSLGCFIESQSDLLVRSGVSLKANQIGLFARAFHRESIRLDYQKQWITRLFFILLRTNQFSTVTKRTNENLFVVYLFNVANQSFSFKCFKGRNFRGEKLSRIGPTAKFSYFAGLNFRG